MSIFENFLRKGEVSTRAINRELNELEDRIDEETPTIITIACSDETTNLTVGAAKASFRAPIGFILSEVRASVNTAPTGSSILIDIYKNGVSILSTFISIDSSTKTSVVSPVQPVISDSVINDDDEITIDLTQIGSTISGTGLKVTLIGN
jgi:hypothetical protein